MALCLQLFLEKEKNRNRQQQQGAGVCENQENRCGKTSFKVHETTLSFTLSCVDSWTVMCYYKQ